MTGQNGVKILLRDRVANHIATNNLPESSLAENKSVNMTTGLRQQFCQMQVHNGLSLGSFGATQRWFCRFLVKFSPTFLSSFC